MTFVTMVSYVITSPDISIFRLSNDDAVMAAIPYPQLSYFIWILFGVIMSVLFLNFLVYYYIYSTAYRGLNLNHGIILESLIVLYNYDLHCTQSIIHVNTKHSNFDNCYYVKIIIYSGTISALSCIYTLYYL